MLKILCSALFVISVFSTTPCRGQERDFQSEIEEASSLSDEGKLDEAIAILEGAASRHPGNPELYEALGSAYINGRRANLAVRALKTAVSLSPDSASAWMALSRAYNAKLNDVGIFGKLGAARDVRDALERVLKLDPMHKEALQYLSVFYSSAPLVVGRDPVRSKELLDRLSGVDKARWLHAKAKIANNDGDRDAAARHFLASVALAPNYEEVYLDAATLLKSLHRSRDALGVLVSGYEHADEPKALLYQLARLASETHEQCQVAMVAVTKYLSIPPVFRNIPEAWIMYRKGLLHHCLGDDVAARDHYAQALRLDPGLGEAKKAMVEVR